MLAIAFIVGLLGAHWAVFEANQWVRDRGIGIYPGHGLYQYLLDIPPQPLQDPVMPVYWASRLAITTSPPATTTNFAGFSPIPTTTTTASVSPATTISAGFEPSATPTEDSPKPATTPNPSSPPLSSPVSSAFSVAFHRFLWFCALAFLAIARNAVPIWAAMTNLAPAKFTKRRLADVEDSPTIAAPALLSSPNIAAPALLSSPKLGLRGLEGVMFRAKMERMRQQFGESLRGLEEKHEREKQEIGAKYGEDIRHFGEKHEREKQEIGAKYGEDIRHLGEKHEAEEQGARMLLAAANRDKSNMGRRLYLLEQEVRQLRGGLGRS